MDFDQMHPMEKVFAASLMFLIVVHLLRYFLNWA